MIPKSRRTHRGAYRNVVPNEVNGVIENDLFGNAIGNKIKTRLVNEEIGSFGDFNTLLLHKRKVSQKKPRKTFVSNVNISSGDKNSGTIKFMSTKAADLDINVSLGDNNTLDVSTYDEDDISIGSNNTIIGKLDTKNGGVAIGDNNFLIYFEPELTKGRYIKGMPKIGPLMFSTEISEYAGMGQKFITVADTDKISYGMEIIFGSVAAGFVRRNVTAVDGNKVFFEEPLENNESTFPGALAFNEYYDILPAYSSKLSADAKRRTKRIFVDDNQNLHLRKVKIGDDFETVVFFMREADNMTIIKDMTPTAFPAGTPIISQEVNPYSAWTPSITQDETTPEKYSIGGVNKAFIGRSVSIDNVSYHIIGYTLDTVTFSQALPEGTTSLHFEEIDSSPSGEMVTSYLSESVAGNTMLLPVTDGTKFFVGQKIKVEGMSTLGTISVIDGNTLILEKQLFDDVITDRFYIGLRELIRSAGSEKSFISNAEKDLHAYIFGEES